MNVKKKSRLRRASKTRFKLRELKATRLCINRTPRHIYAQIISGDDNKVIASASTLDKAVDAKAGGNKSAAEAVGKLVAERAKKAGIEAVAFDRSGYKYHGRVQALADAAREAGLKF